MHLRIMSKITPMHSMPKKMMSVLWSSKRLVSSAVPLGGMPLLRLLVVTLLPLVAMLTVVEATVMLYATGAGIPAYVNLAAAKPRVELRGAATALLVIGAIDLSGCVKGGWRVVRLYLSFCGASVGEIPAGEDWDLDNGWRSRCMVFWALEG